MMDTTDARSADHRRRRITTPRGLRVVQGNGERAPRASKRAPALSRANLQTQLRLLNQALKREYVIERRIGRGAMAEVYLAQDLRHDRRVAIKIFAGHRANAIGAERFLREIETTARLQHPHLLPVFDSGAGQDFFYYTMPWADGGTLRDRLDRGELLPVDEVLSLVRDVIDALGYAHEHDIVHRDIKPENVMLLRGHALVADFGIAKLLGAGSIRKLSLTGAPMGTPAYMAPEQIFGSQLVDHRADIYAVGALAYELLSGSQVFPRKCAQQVMRAHLHDPPPIPSRPGTRLNRRVVRVVLKCLEKAPRDRWRNAQELLEALDDARFGGGWLRRSVEVVGAALTGRRG